MSNAENMKARYYARKAARLCVTCGAGLQDEDGVRCVECYDANLRRPRARANRRAASRRAYWRNPELARAQRRRAYDEKKIRGICTMCPDPAAEDSNLCVKHLESERARNRNDQRRRREERSAA